MPHCWLVSSKAHLLSNILIELAWHTLLAVIMYLYWYYPVGFVRNTTSDDQAIRGFLIFLFLWVYLLFTSTFAHFAIFWMLCILFCGWVDIRRHYFLSDLHWILISKPESGFPWLIFRSSGPSCIVFHPQHTLLGELCRAQLLTRRLHVPIARFSVWLSLETWPAMNSWLLTSKPLVASFWTRQRKACANTAHLPPLMSSLIDSKFRIIPDGGTLASYGSTS